MTSKTNVQYTLYSHKFKQILSEMRKCNYDSIRFATYRTASKIRFIQKHFYLHIIDLGNIVEALRPLSDNLNQSKKQNVIYTEININELQDIVLLELYQSLNRRLLPQYQIKSITTLITNLTSWLALVYDSENSGRLRLFSIQIALVILCSGKYHNKMKYIFSLISDERGVLVMDNYLDFCKEATMLPASLYEPTSMGFNDTSALALFDNKKDIRLEEFLDVHTKYPGPYYLMWFSLVYRMASVENVIHDVRCSVCSITPIKGFRYQCQNCPGDVTLCQDCFWRGNIASTHTLGHEMKEFSSSRPNKIYFSGYRLPKHASKCIPLTFTTNPLRKSCGAKRVSEQRNIKRMGDSITNLSVDQSISSSHEKYKDNRYNDTSSDTYSSLRDVRSLDAEENARTEHNIITNLLDILRQKGELKENSISPDQKTGKNFAGNIKDRLSRRTAIISYLEQRNKDIAAEIRSLQRAKLYDGERDKMSYGTKGDTTFLSYSHRTLPNLGVRRKQAPKQSNYATLASPIYDEPRYPQEVHHYTVPQQPHKGGDTSQDVGSIDDFDETYSERPSSHKSSYQELRALWSKKDELECRMDDLYRERMRLAAQLRNVMGVLGEEEIGKGSNKNFGTGPRPLGGTMTTSHHPTSMGASLPDFFESSHRMNGKPSLTPLLENLSLDRPDFSYESCSNNSMRSGPKEPRSRGFDSDSCTVHDHLLLAADSVTNAMSTLVSELNTSDGEDMSSENFYDRSNYQDSLNSKYSDQLRHSNDRNSLRNNRSHNGRNQPEYEEYLERILEK